jgi:hypothetical protein
VTARAATVRNRLSGECTRHANQNHALLQRSYSSGIVLAGARLLARFLLALRLARDLLASALRPPRGAPASALGTLLAGAPASVRRSGLRTWHATCGRSGLRAALRPPLKTWHDLCSDFQWFSGVDNLWTTCGQLVDNLGKTAVKLRILRPSQKVVHSPSTVCPQVIHRLSTGWDLTA